MGENTKTKADRLGNLHRGICRNGSNARPTNKISSQHHKSKILELEDDTFNCGHWDNTARFDSAVEAIGSYVVHTCRGGVHVGTGIRELAAPNLAYNLREGAKAHEEARTP